MIAQIEPTYLGPDFVSSIIKSLDLFGILDERFPANSTITEYANLRENSHPKVAHGNCRVVTNFLHRNIYEYVGLNEGEEAWPYRISFTDETSHEAILITKGDEEIIVDFTASQFDKTLPFPLVMEVGEWAQTIATAAHKKFGVVFAEHGKR